MQLRRPDEPWLIPVRFDNCNIPGRDIGGGRSLASIHAADLFDDSFHDGATKLIAAIERIFGRAYHEGVDLGGPAMARIARDHGY